MSYRLLPSLKSCLQFATLEIKPANPINTNPVYVILKDQKGFAVFFLKTQVLL